jgi:hypothetical protein
MLRLCSCVTFIAGFICKQQQRLQSFHESFPKQCFGKCLHVRTKFEAICNLIMSIPNLLFFQEYHLGYNAEGACHLFSRWILAQLIFSTLKMEAISSSETSVDTQRTTWRYFPEDGTLHNHWCENLISYTLFFQCFDLLSSGIYNPMRKN